MSRSNPTEASQHPCSRWIEWDGANGNLRFYNKEKKENVDMGNKFTFILLDQLSVIRGWHDPSESGIHSNEVKDTRSTPFVVKAFKGKGILAEGIYGQIKDRVAAIGGVFHINLYVAFKLDGEMKIGSVMFKGAALREWSEFRNANRNELYKKAVDITGFTEGKKGQVKFCVPKFALREITPETNEAAVELDGELQKYLSAYLKRPVVEQSERTTTPEPEQEPETRNTYNPNEEDVDGLPF